MMADGRTIVVRGELVIGRVAGCDVVLADTKASRRHARLIVEAGVVEIEDLGSSNGTLLNGKPVTRRVLRPGDEVQIGSHVLVYREGALPTGSSAAMSSPAPSAPAGGSDELFGDDDDDLFAGAAPAAPSAAPVEPPPPPPPPTPAPAPVQSPPAAPPTRVVEFADEVVEVKKRPAPADKEKKGAAPAASTEMVQQPRILQFSKKEARGGVLGDDLGQMGGGMKVLVYAAVLALGVGVAYGLIALMR